MSSRALDLDTARKQDVVETSTHYLEESMKDDLNFPEMFKFHQFGVSLKYLSANKERDANSRSSATAANNSQVLLPTRESNTLSKQPYIYSPFELVQSLSIPDEIFSQFNDSNLKSQMGIFPEINRAWISIDNRLYFWNYSKPEDTKNTNNNNYQLFDELQEVINTVKLVKPRKGVFIDSVNYLLVIATTDDIYLVAVSFDSAKDTISLFDSGMSVSISGLKVDQIAADPKSGRIFFTGLNTHCNIYEVLYNSEESWFRSKCTKIMRTNTGLGPGLLSSGVSYLFGHANVFKSGKKSQNNPQEPPIDWNKAGEIVMQLKIDESRSLIYTLSSLDRIRVYAMRSDSEELPQVGTLNASTLIGQAMNLKRNRIDLGDAGTGSIGRDGADYGAEDYADHSEKAIIAAAKAEERRKRHSARLIKAIDSQIAADIQIVSIEPVSAKQSEGIYFVAISSKGARFYFTASSPPTTLFTNQPVSFSCYHIRPSPACINHELPMEIAQESARFLSPHYLFVPFGQDVSSDKDNANSSIIDIETDKLLCCALDTMFYTTNPGGDYEVYDLLPIEGFVSAIEVISSPPFAAADTPLGFANEAAAQFTLPPTKVAALTSTGLFIYERVYPQTAFDRCVTTPKLFNGFYGSIATCTAALAYACAGHLKDESTKSLATQSFVDFSESPYFIKQSKYKIQFLASGSCQGFATYLARITRLNWHQHVFKISKVDNTIKNDNNEKIPDGTKRTEIMLTSTKQQLELLQQRLWELLRFFEVNRTIIKGLDEFPVLDSADVSKLRQPKVSAEKGSPWTWEHRILNGLLELTKSIYDGVGFLLLIVEQTMGYRNGINAALEYLSQATLDEMKNLTFKQFFSEPKGREIAKELVTCLMNLHIARGGSVGDLAKILTDRCESFCSPADIILYRASECLRKAKVNKDSVDSKVMNLYDSLLLFKEGVAGLSQSTLQEAVQEYVDLDFFQGAVEICLIFAKTVGSRFEILRYIKAGKPEGDLAAVPYQKRLEIYRVIFLVLDSADMKSESTSNSDSYRQQLTTLRDDAYKVCFFSSDEIFHYCFYDWFFERHQESRLMDVDTPHLLPYLMQKAEDDVRYADIMWVYCQKRGDYLTAAQQLFKLATSSNFEIRLQNRIEYLSRAKTYCSSTVDPSSTRDLNELASTIDDYAATATLQDDLIQAIKNDDRLTEAQKNAPLKELENMILEITILYNKFAKPMEYYDVCLACFKVADYRDTAEIIENWNKLLSQVASRYAPAESYKHVALVVQNLGMSFMLNEAVFPVAYLIEYLETFYYQTCPGAPNGWVAECFVNVGVDYEPIYGYLLELLDRTEFPFSEPECKMLLCKDIFEVLKQWISNSRPHNVLQHVTMIDLNKLGRYDPHSLTLVKRRLGLA